MKFKTLKLTLLMLLVCSLSYCGQTNNPHNCKEIALAITNTSSDSEVDNSNLDEFELEFAKGLRRIAGSRKRYVEYYAACKQIEQGNR